LASDRVDATRIVPEIRFPISRRYHIQASATKAADLLAALELCVPAFFITNVAQPGAKHNAERFRVAEVENAEARHSGLLCAGTDRPHRHRDTR